MPSRTRPVLKAGFETTGSTRWIIQAITSLGLDHKQGFALDLQLHQQQGDAYRTAPEAALHAGAIDLIDTDWLSICRARAAGTPLVAGCPYGRIMGGLVARVAADIPTLECLRERRVGLLRETDKNWKVLRAWAKQAHGFDPAAHCEIQVIPSKSDLEARLQDGRIDAAIIFWHRIPQLLSTPGLHEVCDVVDLVEALIGTSPATTFFAFREAYIASHPQVVAGFCRAYGEAIQTLIEQPTVWSSIVGLPPSDARDDLYSRWQKRMVTQWSAQDFEHLVQLHEQVCKIDERPLAAPASHWFRPVPAANMANSVLREAQP